LDGALGETRVDLAIAPLFHGAAEGFAVFRRRSLRQRVAGRWL
jgi:hypothetical protein